MGGSTSSKLDQDCDCSEESSSGILPHYQRMLVMTKSLLNVATCVYFAGNCYCSKGFGAEIVIMNIPYLPQVIWFGRSFGLDESSLARDIGTERFRGNL